LRSCLYAGRVVHERLRPVRHRFAYRVLSLLLDLDELDEVNRRLRLFSVGRPNLLSFRPADHGPCDGAPLKPWALDKLARAGIVLAEPRVELLCLPRVLGYAFNPLSVWFCHDGGRLAAVLYEVRNTFGGRHRYVVPVDGRGPVARHRVPKAFHVSPFIPMDAAYDFALRPPGERLAVAIGERDARGPLLLASHTGRRLPLTDAAIAAAVLRDPVVTLRVIAGIHGEAFMLWLKGAPRFRRASAPSGRT
jgi:uncharacterized protein